MRDEAKKRRSYWVAELAKLSGSFIDHLSKMMEELRTEIATQGLDALIDHLRLCGAMPEQYGHDSTEEKLYAKYTDALVSESLAALGLNSVLIPARADAADVQARGADYSLVADAKAFRLSRTAKNQKDFKVQAMDGWRGGLDYAVLICPIYQLPGTKSQIYQQAISRNVCILSYSHLAALVRLGARKGASTGEKGFHDIIRCIELMHPSNSAVDYWTTINRSLIDVLGSEIDIWNSEKQESIESLDVLKGESLHYLRFELDRLLRLSHQQALDELIRAKGIGARIAQIEGLVLGKLLNLGI